MIIILFVASMRHQSFAAAHRDALTRTLSLAKRALLRFVYLDLVMFPTLTIT